MQTADDRIKQQETTPLDVKRCRHFVRAAVLATWIIRSENPPLNDFDSRSMTVILIKKASIERLSFSSVFVSNVDKLSLSPQLYSW
jgi:hypothetical protein